jgi:putative mycofactocin binding protein MftB
MGYDKKYGLSPGTQVREEDFGLLFYTMNGPRLYFLRCGSLLESDFFKGEISLARWLERRCPSEAEALSLENSLARLKAKGVILEC